MPDPTTPTSPSAPGAREEPIVGTDTLGRPFTTLEKLRFGKLLRKHDFPGARLVALRFAHKKTGNQAEAEDVVGRVELRLVRLGWDPNEVPLVKHLCRLVFSEYTHMVAERKVARQAEGRYVQDMKKVRNAHQMAPDALAAMHAQHRDEEAAAQAQLDALRKAFHAADDDVNVEWLDHSLRGIESLQEMATRSRRDVEEFYDAADRRKAHMKRLIAAGIGSTLKEDP
jgi:hypothetical protein